MSNEMTTDAGLEKALHPFERAGLGKAPFAVLFVEVRIGPVDLGNGLTVGAPGQPMGCCHYCGQGIAEVWTVRGSDGRRFEVGCDCVRKAGQVRMTKAGSKARAELSHARDDRRIEAAVETLERPEVLAALRSSPAPASSRSADLLEWVGWMLEHAGRAGKIRAARAVEAAAKGKLPAAPAPAAPAAAACDCGGFGTCCDNPALGEDS